MSGFESFESSDKSMNCVKDFLMAERNVTPEKDSQNLRCDLDKDFQQTLKEKCSTFRLSYDKENFEPIGNNSSEPTLVKTKLPYLNELLMPMSSKSENCLETNDSFLYLEKICDNTVSDPNSTLHSYVENMRKNNSSSNTTNEDEENAAIERLLNTEKLEKESCKKLYSEIPDEEDNYKESVFTERCPLQSIDDKNKVLDKKLCDSNKVLNIFSGTSEKVDYILKKDMKIMNTTIGQAITIKNTIKKSATLNVHAPSPKKQSPKTPNTKISNQVSIEKKAPNTNNQKNLFKKPTFSGRSLTFQQPSFLKANKNKYAHVISPVGAYIKNTPKTPTINNIRETTVRSLDYDEMGENLLPSRQHLNLKSNSNGYPSSLPKKAYQSANYVEIRDERVPLNIPGGNKIHKYLQSALVPAVVRHEGKMKIIKSSSIDGCSDDTSPMVNTTVDSSLADLSLMSGDVSLYTIRDAQNFGNNIEHK